MRILIYCHIITIESIGQLAPQSSSSFSGVLFPPDPLSLEGPLFPIQRFAHLHPLLLTQVFALLGQCQGRFRATFLKKIKYFNLGLWFGVPIFTINGI